MVSQIHIQSYMPNLLPLKKKKKKQMWLTFCIDWCPPNNQIHFKQCENILFKIVFNHQCVQGYIFFYWFNMTYTTLPGKINQVNAWKCYVHFELKTNEQKTHKSKWKHTSSSTSKKWKYDRSNTHLYSSLLSQRRSSSPSHLLLSYILIKYG